MGRPTSLFAPLLSFATIGLLLPAVLHADDGQPPARQGQKTVAAEPAVIDVSLRAAGLLNGQVVSPEGKPVAGETVYILRGTTVVATCQTNQAGGFAAQGLSGGMYEIRCHQGAIACRLWRPETAPPSAKSTLLMTSGAPIVRGQTAFFSRRGSWFKGPAPWIIAGVVAVVVPVALTVHHHSSSS